MAAILRLGADLARREIDAATLHDYLKTLDTLREEGCDYEDVPEALRLITLLQALPFAWDWSQAETAIKAVAAVLESGITLEQVHGFLGRHQQLEALGFQESTAIAVNEALARAGAIGNRREAVLDMVIALARQHVEVQALEAQREGLQAEVAGLEASVREHAARLDSLRAEANVLQEEVAQRHETNARLDEECERQAGGLAVVQALQAFLAGRTTEAEALWTALEALFRWRKNGGRTDGSVGALFTDGVKQKMLGFFQQLIRDAAAK